MPGQTCQVAVATAIFQKKSLVAVKKCVAASGHQVALKDLKSLKGGPVIFL
jgi:hypothetical protein